MEQSSIIVSITKKLEPEWVDDEQDITEEVYLIIGASGKGILKHIINYEDGKSEVVAYNLRITTSYVEEVAKDLARVVKTSTYWCEIYDWIVGNNDFELILDEIYFEEPIKDSEREPWDKGDDSEKLDEEDNVPWSYEWYDDKEWNCYDVSSGNCPSFGTTD